MPPNGFYDPYGSNGQPGGYPPSPAQGPMQPYQTGPPQPPNPYGAYLPYGQPQAPYGPPGQPPLGQPQPNQPYSYAQQPPMPDYPYPDPYSLDDAYAQPVRSKKSLFIGLAATAVLLVGGAMFALAGGGSTSNEQLFQNALDNAMQTKSYTWKLTAEGASGEYKIDVSDISKVRLSGMLKLDELGADVEGYATMANTLVKLTEAEATSSFPVELDSWIQVRKDGKIIDAMGTGGTTFDQLFTPYQVVYQLLPFGNYAQIDRADLLNYINTRKVFEYDPLKAVKASEAGQAVLKYEVSINRAARAELLRKIAELAKVSQQQIDELLALEALAVAENSASTISVSVKDQRIVKVEDKGAGAVVATYGSYNMTEVGDAPEAKYTWDELAGTSAAANPTSVTATP